MEHGCVGKEREVEIKEVTVLWPIMEGAGDWGRSREEGEGSMERVPTIILVTLILMLIYAEMHFVVETTRNETDSST